MRLALALAALIASPAMAQQVVKHTTPLSPVNRTAQSAGNLVITPTGVSPSIIGDGIAPIQFVGSYWRDWDGDGQKDTADLFAVSRSFQPLCDGSVSYIAVYRNSLGLGISAFRGANAPVDANSAGLCATYSYD